MKKFGEVLTSREAGREAYAAFLPTLRKIGDDEKIEIDFAEVSVLSPSWADEFIRPTVELYDARISFLNDANPSVKSALRFANPKLDLSKMKVFQDKIVFEEAKGDEIYQAQRPLSVLLFPYTDEEALRILQRNKIKKIKINPVDILQADRLKSVAQKLNDAGIEADIIKKL